MPGYIKNIQCFGNWNLSTDIFPFMWGSISQENNPEIPFIWQLTYAS
jgi:hypothetical protein